jgi:hypothetical protein
LFNKLEADRACPNRNIRIAGIVQKERLFALRVIGRSVNSDRQVFAVRQRVLRRFLESEPP